jgi:hypothetical protein
MVRSGVARGRAHGLTWESSLTKFVALMFVIAPNFDRQPAAAAVLSDASLAPDERVDALIDRLSERDWRQARAAANAGAWFAAT